MLSMLREAHITGWRRHVELRPKPAAGAERLRKAKSGRIRVRPDFTFRTQRVAVFVDGCFWHGCPIHCLQPKQNAEFWTAKLKANQCRDTAQSSALKAAGWTVVRLWEHDLTRPGNVLLLLADALAISTRSPERRWQG